MQTFLKIFLSVFIFCIIGACSGEKKGKEETKAKTDHPFRSQFDALEKAKNADKKVQDAFSKQSKQLEKPEQ